MNSARLKFFILIILLCVPVRVSPQVHHHWPMFRKHQLDEGPFESVTVADLNKDGRLDIISGENWFEAPAWKKHRVRQIESLNGYTDDFSNLTMDVNLDGYPDVIACSWFGKKLSWYENPGNRSRGREDFDPAWVEHVIETGNNYELALLVDINGDGKAEEILPNYGSSGEVVWFERSGPAAKSVWVRHGVGKVPEVRGLHGTGAGDLNGDQRPDIITPYGWFEGPARAASGQWAFHPEFRLLPQMKNQCSPIYAYDVNGDRRTDLIYGAAHDYGVYWLENKAAGQWEERLIDESWSQAHALTLVDLDRDGRLDVITGKRYLAHDTDPGAYEQLGLYWYRLQAGGQFTKHVIDFGSKAGGGMQIYAGDINSDGRMDVVAAGKSGIYLWEGIDPPRNKTK